MYTIYSTLVFVIYCCCRRFKLNYNPPVCELQYGDFIMFCVNANNTPIRHKITV